MTRSQRSVASSIRVAVLACAVILVSLFVSSSVFAQSSVDSVSITVSPQSLDTAVNPGQSTVNVFRVTNGSEQSITIQPTPKNFVPRGNEGAIQIEEEETPYSLAQWLSVEPAGEVVIGPKQTADFEVTINVPENADPGGHFGSVVFRTLPSDLPGSAATVSQEVAPVILVRVPGDAREQIVVTSFRADNIFLTNSESTSFEIITRNEGNVHLKPSGTISIFNTFGKQVASAQVEGSNVIPGAERKMVAAWEESGFRLGRYTARLTMVYGKDNQIVTAQTSFMIVPVRQVVPIAAAVIVVLFVLFRIRRRLLLAAKVLAGKQVRR